MEDNNRSKKVWNVWYAMQIDLADNYVLIFASVKGHAVFQYKMASGIQNRNDSQQTLNSMLEPKKSKLYTNLESLKLPDKLITQSQLESLNMDEKPNLVVPNSS